MPTTGQPLTENGTGLRRSGGISLGDRKEWGMTQVVNKARPGAGGGKGRVERTRWVARSHSAF